MLDCENMGVLVLKPEASIQISNQTLNWETEKMIVIYFQKWPILRTNIITETNGTTQNCLSFCLILEDHHIHKNWQSSLIKIRANVLSSQKNP
jgi:hypothetical protein